MSDRQQHSSHSAIVARLRRAEGHLRNVIEMFENERPCVQLAQQLHAVEKAISAAKKALIHDHIEHCLEDVVGTLKRDDRGQLDEFKEIAKYL